MIFLKLFLLVKESSRSFYTAILLSVIQFSLSDIDGGGKMRCTSLVEDGIPTMSIGTSQASEVQNKSVEEAKLKDLKKYQGSTKVKRAQLQALRREFELLTMKEGEKIDTFLGRTLKVVNKMKVNGETMEQSTVNECPEWEKKANYAELEEEEELLLMSYLEKHQANREEVWFLDSGCSNHMTGCKDWFFDLEEGFNRSVKLGNDTRMSVVGKGSVKIQVNGVTQVIPDVYYVLDLKNNLLSLGQLQERGLAILIRDGTYKVYHPKKEKHDVLEDRRGDREGDEFVASAFWAFKPRSSKTTCTKKDGYWTVDAEVHEGDMRDKSWDWHQTGVKEKILDCGEEEQNTDMACAPSTANSSPSGSSSSSASDGNSTPPSPVSPLPSSISSSPSRSIEGEVVTGPQTRRTPGYLADYVTGKGEDEEESLSVMLLIMMTENDPVKFKEAVKDKMWREAMKNEIEAIEKNNTWELTILPAEGS
ncbi:hypothetical protein VNO80_02762 [Phaseolus coccineus]|uniref:Retrovirus-related Pol polyprotein from transposon TNT 1-94-like beta-barrel domain-containing protein n=1 Tax=Phaseolus coccineus TaxID=3886 RepID=A0AAN9NQ24_PHACN